MKVDRNAKNPVINSYALILMRTGSPSKSFFARGTLYAISTPKYRERRLTQWLY